MQLERSAKVTEKVELTPEEKRRIMLEEREKKIKEATERYQARKKQKL